MRRFCVGLAAVFLCPALAVADGEKSDCGGDAYSFAVVAPPQPPRHRGGPIVVVPDTMCADLATNGGTRIDSLSIYLDRRAGNPAQQGDLPRPGAPARRR